MSERIIYLALYIFKTLEALLMIAGCPYRRFIQIHKFHSEEKYSEDLKLNACSFTGESAAEEKMR